MAKLADPSWGVAGAASLTHIAMRGNRKQVAAWDCKLLGLANVGKEVASWA